MPAPASLIQPRLELVSSSGVLVALKAISDETRVRILHILSFGAFSVNEIVEILGMGQSRISRHLKILTEAKLIQSRREGSLVYNFIPEEWIGSHFPKDLVQLLLTYKEELPFREKDQSKLHQILELRERRSKSFFDSHAETWEHLQEEVLVPKLYRPWILEHLPTCETILDLGCGPGGLLPFLLNKAKTAIGVDQSSKMIEKASKDLGSNPNVQLFVSTMQSLPLPSESCDAVVTSMVMHHISHPPTVLEEIARVLRPGGTLCLVDLAKHEEEFMRETFSDLWLGFEPEVLESWLDHSGFLVEEVRMMDTPSLFKILMIKASKQGGQNVHSNRN